MRRTFRFGVEVPVEYEQLQAGEIDVMLDTPAPEDLDELRGVQQFHCPPEAAANLGGWCDEALDARIDEALVLSLTDPGAANRVWTQIEHELVEAAVQVPVTNLVFNYAVTDRVGNVQVHPHWGLLPGRLWID